MTRSDPVRNQNAAKVLSLQLQFAALQYAKYTSCVTVHFVRSVSSNSNSSIISSTYVKKLHLVTLIIHNLYMNKRAGLHSASRIHHTLLRHITGLDIPAKKVFLRNLLKICAPITWSVN